MLTKQRDLILIPVLSLVKCQILMGPQAAKCYCARTHQVQMEDDPPINMYKNECNLPTKIRSLAQT